jgi:Icc-related predicted phosphoesterase
MEDELLPRQGIETYGSPWQPEFCNWAFNKNRGADIKEKWDLIPDTTDVLITHGPPKDILDLCAHGGRAGCEMLRDAVVDRVKPRLHIFGHIHEGYGRYTV